MLDGAIRDRAEIAALGLPGVLSRHLAARPGEGRARAPSASRSSSTASGSVPATLSAPTRTGWRVVPAADVEEVEAAVVALEAKEAGIVAELRRGGTTVDVFGLKELG